MQTFERRIAALEQANPEGYTAMFIRLVRPGELGKEIQLIASDPYTANRIEWKRKPGESEQALQDRAEREAARSPTGCKVFICS